MLGELLDNQFVLDGIRHERWRKLAVWYQNDNQIRLRRLGVQRELRAASRNANAVARVVLEELGNSVGQIKVGTLLVEDSNGVVTTFPQNGDAGHD